MLLQHLFIQKDICFFMDINEVIGPRQVVLVTCRGNVKKELAASLEEKDNIFTANWHMPCADDKYCIAVRKDSHSFELIDVAGCFVVNFIPATMKKEADFCGTVSGKRVNKIKELGLALEEGTTVDCPHLKNAVGFLECKVINRVDCGDYELFVGKIMNIKMIDKEAKRLIS